MLPVKSIARIFAAEVTSKVILGISHIVIIRALPVGEFGRFSFLYATAFAITNFSGVALNRAMMVQTAKGGEQQRPLVAGALVSCVGGAVLIPIVGVVGSYSFGGILSAGTFVVGYLLLDYLRSLHQAEMRFREYSLIEVVRSALVVASTFVALHLPPTSRWGIGRAEALLYLQGGAMLAMAAPWVVWVRRPKGRPSLRSALAGWRDQFNAGRIALFFYFAAVGLIGQIEVFVLKTVGTESDLAVFSAAFRYYSLLLMATGAVSAVLTPLAQRIDTAHSFLDLLRQGRGYFLVFGVVTLVSIPCLYAVRGLLGLEKYPGFLAVYAILCVASVQAIFLSPHVSALMRMQDHGFLNAVAYAVILGSIASCALLVRMAGPAGAAMSYCAANLVLNGLAYRRAHRVISICPAAPVQAP
jgi:O-antigen/teichoic acid export membrane protein